MPSTAAASDARRATQNGRDEVTELSRALRSLSARPSNDSRANADRRALFRRVNALVTSGVDCASLFSDVVVNAHASDPGCKKMIYGFITRHARRNGELAILTVNALQKDSGDRDSTIRGLAIRSLASLGVKDLLEYSVTAVERGLDDDEAYPRATAAMGALKIYDVDAKTVRESEILEKLRKMLVSDTEEGVVGNCLIVLKEIDGAESLATKPIVYALINRIKSFSEWNQVLILDLVARYKIENADETFDIMNALESRLAAPNSAIVLGTVKVFLTATLEMPDIHQQVLERIKAPLFTLANSGMAETSYAVWAHLRLLVRRAPVLFATDHKSFYFRMSDSSAVKNLKLAMLVAVADAQNTYDIVTEITEYATDADECIAAASVRAVGDIALKAADELEGIVDRLLQYFDLDIEYVTAETVLAVADIVRKRPAHATQCVEAMKNIDLYDVLEPSARATLIWFYGEYGEHIPMAPYFVEPVLTNMVNESDPKVRAQLLTCAMKLFFKRPPEMQAMLGAALAACVRDANQEVRDLANTYYRLLQKDVCAAERVVNSRDDSPIYTFKETMAEDKVFDKVFAEFNTLSVLYGRPAETFIDPEAAAHRRARTIQDEDEIDDVKRDEEEKEQQDLGGASLLDHADMIDFGDEEKASTPTSRSGSAADLLSLLEIDVPPQASTASTLALDPAPALDPVSFQSKWTSASLVASGLQATLRSVSVSSATQITAHLTSKGIATMASGGPPDAMKFFFYAVDASVRDIFLVEAMVDARARGSTFTIKCDGRGSNFVAFQRLFADALASVP